MPIHIALWLSLKLSFGVSSVFIHLVWISLKCAIIVLVRAERVTLTKQSPSTGWSEILDIHWNPTTKTEIMMCLHSHSCIWQILLHIFDQCLHYPGIKPMTLRLLAFTKVYCLSVCLLQCMCKQCVALPVAECGEAHRSRHESHSCGERIGPAQ